MRWHRRRSLRRLDGVAWLPTVSDGAFWLCERPRQSGPSARRWWNLSRSMGLDQPSRTKARLAEGAPSATTVKEAAASWRESRWQR